VSTVLITGASRGVGRGLVEAFVAAHWEVAITARVLDDAVAVQRAVGGDTIAIEADVTVPDSLELAIESAAGTFGSLQAVIHNAVSVRSSEPTDLETASLELWEEHASVSLRGLWRCARAAHPHLRDSHGALLVLTSPAGMNGSANGSLYGAVKGGQRAFVRSLAREWGPEGITVNALAPLAMTPALQNAFITQPDMEARLTSIIPLRRFGDPATDIGPAAVFLCGPGARYVTGQNLVVSGGRLTTS
jgi:3-oxoacyl-[acyl-carrier protein] reductase